MQRYFFHIFNDTVTFDEEGIELPGDREAERRAYVEARILAAESIRSEGHLDLNHRIEVENAAGEKIAVVTFGDAVEVRS
jgi:hypothetical protein